MGGVWKSGRGLEQVVACRIEAFELGDGLDAPCGTPGSLDEDDEVDRLGNRAGAARLRPLPESVVRSGRAQLVPSWHGPWRFRRGGRCSRPSACRGLRRLLTSPTMMRSGRKRSVDRTRSARLADARLGPKRHGVLASQRSSRVSSMMTTRSSRPAISASSALASVVLPEPVPPAIRMLRPSVTAVGQHLGHQGRNNLRPDVIGQAECGRGGLADGKAWRQRDRRQNAFKAFASFGSSAETIGDEPLASARTWLATKPDDPLGLLRRQDNAGVGAACPVSIEPQLPVGVDHDLDNIGFLQSERRSPVPSRSAACPGAVRGSLARGDQTLPTSSRPAGECSGGSPRRARRTGSDIARLGQRPEGALLQVPHKEIRLRGADAIHDVGDKPATGGDLLLPTWATNISNRSRPSARGVLVLRGQRRGNGQVVANEKRDGLGQDAEVAVGSFELPAHPVKSSDQRRIAACVPLWIEKAVERGIHDGRLVGSRTLGGELQPLRDAIGDVGRAVSVSSGTALQNEGRRSSSSRVTAWARRTELDGLAACCIWLRSAAVSSARHRRAGVPRRRNGLHSQARPRPTATIAA